MQTSLPPNPIIGSIERQISDLLRNCTFKQLKQIHGFIITNSIDQNTRISANFLRRSTEFGKMEYPELLFRRNPMPEIFLWNNMIRGYAHNGPSEKCISMYRQMQKQGTKPNSFTFPFVLQACSNLRNFRDGQKIHCRILKEGLESVLIISKSLLDFYWEIDRLRYAHRMLDEIPERSVDFLCFSEIAFAGGGKLSNAQKIFDQMKIKPVELWNCMISEYINQGEIEFAQKLFDKMPERDVVSWNSMISGYAKAGDLEKCGVLFHKMPEKNVISWTSIMGAFANSGKLKIARQLFDKMPERNLVSWNSMISCYTQNGKFKEALDLFMEMQQQGVNPDGFTVVSALSCCAHVGSLDLGKWLHFYFIRNGSQLGIQVSTALIEMYAKCGDVDRAFKVFIKMINKDVFCWNVMIKSLAIHGQNEDAIKLFSIMQAKGFKPNDFTFSSVLFACNHGGLIEQGLKIFYSMERDFSIDPKIEHYGCLIDLLGRNGRLEEAVLVMRKMPFEPDIAVWGALLGGCRVRGDFELAGEVMNRIAKLKTDESGVFVLASNIYAASDRWLEAMRTREKMDEKGICKKAGLSML